MSPLETVLRAYSAVLLAERESEKADHEVQLAQLDARAYRLDVSAKKAALWEALKGLDEAARGSFSNLIGPVKVTDIRPNRWSQSGLEKTP